MSKNIVVKDNALINASYNLELIEQRLILLAVVQARKSGKSLTKQDKVIINVADYAQEFDVTASGSLYQNLKNACDVLFERQFSYKELIGDEVKYTKSRWVHKVSYIPTSATIELHFTDDVLQFITALESHFTSYDLEQVSDLKSKYSVRLYEILIAWRSQGKTPMINLEDLRSRLGVEDNEYKLISDFKKCVTDLAIKEISEKTDIQATYEQHKAGRKIIGFTFKFKKTKAKNKDVEETTRDKNTLDMLTPIKMTDKQRSFFASKLAHDEPKCSQLPYGNESYEALARWIEKDLLKPERAEFYRPLLVKHGFKE
ncbi:replication initiation protein RepM [Kaistella sp.]|uniref:replication initiation protein RepM n=1 Tax=Kaistella sp. TaxID=2782235 RepID=UPI0035A00145